MTVFNQMTVSQYLWAGPRPWIFHTCRSRNLRPWARVEEFCDLKCVQPRIWGFWCFWIPHELQCGSCMGPNLDPASVTSCTLHGSQHVSTKALHGSEQGTGWIWVHRLSGSSLQNFSIWTFQLWILMCADKRHFMSSIPLCDCVNHWIPLLWP